MHRQGPQHLERRQRRMQEEAERLRQSGLPEAGAERNQVEIVNPDDVVGVEQRRKLACEVVVDAEVGVELWPLEFEEPRPIVEEGPKRVVAEAVVVLLEPCLVQVDRRVGDAAALTYFRVVRLAVRELAVPAEPDPAAFLECAEHSDREPTRRTDLPRIRDPIRHRDDAGHSASSHDRLKSTAEFTIPTML